MSHYDEPNRACLARLIEAGARVDLSPYDGESPQSFADRVAQAGRDRRRYMRIAARLAISAALVCFGIASF